MSPSFDDARPVPPAPPEPEGRPIDPARWEHEYQSGRWSYLRGVSESTRHAIVAGYVRRYVPAAHLLDVGCGEGLLLDHIGPPRIAHYTGIDLSPTALSKIPSAEWIHLIHGDIDSRHFDNDQQFDAIVISEVLYYIPLPLQLLRRLAPMLLSNGILIVSMYSPPAPNHPYHRIVASIWDALVPPLWDTLDDVLLTSRASGCSWQIRAIRKGV